MMQHLGHHPDRGGDTATAALINEAYAVLSNAERRAEYDARLDVMTHVARGVPEGDTGQKPPQPSARTLDLTRECVFCETPHNLGSVIEIDTGCHACGSPLYAADNTRMESAGQRGVERVGTRQKITFFTHWPQPRGITGHIEDISLTGLRLVTRHSLAEGQRIKIASEVVAAVANVTHCIYERRGWTMQCVAGVRFVTLRFGRTVGGFVSNRV